MIVNVMEVCVPISEYSLKLLSVQLLFLAYHENSENPRFVKSFRKSNINASVQTPNGHEGIAASPGLVLYLFGEVGLTGKRNAVSCKLFCQMAVELDCDNMSKAYWLYWSLL